MQTPQDISGDLLDNFYYLLPLLLVGIVVCFARIKGYLAARVFKTKIIKELWWVFLNFGIDGSIQLKKWKRKSAYSIGLYFKKSRENQLTDPIYMDAIKLQKIIQKSNKNSKEILPIIITVDEIINGAILSRDELFEKYSFTP